MKNLRIAAFVVVTVCAFCLPALGQGTQWGLKRISVNNRLTRFAKITREHYDASGGTVEITVDGKTLGGTCPGGSEVLRFKWHFAGDISRVSNGGSLSVNLEADRSLNRPCNGSIAELSSIYISGGEPAPANGQFEVDRF